MFCTATCSWLYITELAEAERDGGEVVYLRDEDHVQLDVEPLDVEGAESFPILKPEAGEMQPGIVQALIGGVKHPFRLAVNPEVTAASRGLDRLKRTAARMPAEHLEELTKRVSELEEWADRMAPASFVKLRIAQKKSDRRKLGDKSYKSLFKSRSSHKLQAVKASGRPRLV